MGKGLYLKENKNSDGNHATSRIPLGERQKRKARRMRKQKQRKLLTLGIGILLCLLIIALLFLRKSSPLEGKWYMDDVTAYEFFDSSNGAMVLPSSEYEFTYIIKDNILRIDFDYEGAKDAQYTFAIDGDILTLEGGNATTQGTYVLRKSE